MFCFPHHDHHSSTRLLHSFRSHRSLRASATQGQNHHQKEDSEKTVKMSHPPLHQRHPSDAPTVSTTTTTTTRSSTDSSRPSTAGRSDRSGSFSSVEWDPLRLHPPLAPAPRLHQQRSLHNFQQHLQLHQTTTPTAPVPTAAAVRHTYSRSAPPAVVIYEGFDFGFGNKSTATTPTSSVASTPEVVGSGFPPTPRRPGPPGGMDAPDYFIKRGGWKRRGIVFSGPQTETDEGSCDEVFDLEC